MHALEEEREAQEQAEAHERRPEAVAGQLAVALDEAVEQHPEAGAVGATSAHA